MGVITRTAWWSAGLVGLLVCAVLASAATGPVRVPPAVVGKVVLNAVAVPTGIEVGTSEAASRTAGTVVPPITIVTDSPFSYAVESTHRTIVMTVRFPRIVLAAVVGFALALAGTVMQGFFRNPMADPSIIGVSAGAAFGAVAVITLPLGIGIHPAAFVGGVATAFAVYLIAREGDRTPVATLLLVGVAVQTLLGAAISFLLVRSGESLEQAVFWLMGHLHSASWGDVRAAGLVLPPLFGLLLLYGRDLNVLLLGEDDAHALGVEVDRTKAVLLAASSVVTASAVAVAGVIGFVGLIVPHGMRLLVGPDHRILLPTSALAGALFLVATDTVARTGAVELPVGIVTAALGAPFFLYLLRTREVSGL